MFEPSAFSTTKDAADFVVKCDKDIIPIYPARFALKYDFLKQFTKLTGWSEYKYPKDIDRTGHMDKDRFCIRRLRQGYVYVFFPNEPNEKDKWHVFRYGTSKNDENSDLEDEVTGHKFHKIECIGPISEKNWKISRESYPYIYAPKGTSKVWIAYSEFEWPSYFFKYVESYPDQAGKLMQEVNLKQKETTYSVRFEEITNYVEEFNPNTEEPTDTKANCLRHTSFGSAKMDNVCDHTKKNGRLVVLADPMGEVLDLDHIHNILLQDSQIRANENLYPYTIGKFVLAIQHGIKPGMFDSYPINAYDISKYCNDQERLEDNAVTKRSHLLIGQAHICEKRASPCAIKDQLEIATSIKTDCDANDFALRLIGRSIKTWGTSPEGYSRVQQIIDMANVESETEIPASGMAKYLSKALINMGKSAKSAANIYYSTRANTGFAVFFEHAFGGIATACQGKGGGAFAVFLREFTGHELESVNYTFKDMLNMYKGDNFYKNLSDLETPAKRKINSSTTRKVLDTELVGLDSKSGNKKFLEGLRARGIAVETANLFVNVYIAFSVISDWKSQQEASDSKKTAVGKAVNDPRVILVKSIADMISAGWNAKRASGVFVGKSGSAAVSVADGIRCFPSIDSTLGTASKALTATALARSLIAVGVVMDACYAYEYYNEGDTTRAIGSAISAAGGLITFGAMVECIPIPVAAQVVGFALMGAGILLSVLGGEDAVTKWVRKSFWGNSDDYWGRDWGSGRPGLGKRMETAKCLAYPNDKNRPYTTTLNYYNEEVRLFEELFMAIDIMNVSGDEAGYYDASGRKFFAYFVQCNAIKDQASLDTYIEVKHDIYKGDQVATLYPEGVDISTPIYRPVVPGPVLKYLSTGLAVVMVYDETSGGKDSFEYHWWNSKKYPPVGTYEMTTRLTAKVFDRHGKELCEDIQNLTWVVAK